MNNGDLATRHRLLATRRAFLIAGAGGLFRLPRAIGQGTLDERIDAAVAPVLVAARVLANAERRVRQAMSIGEERR